MNNDIKSLPLFTSKLIIYASRRQNGGNKQMAKNSQIVTVAIVSVLAIAMLSLYFGGFFSIVDSEQPIPGETPTTPTECSGEVTPDLLVRGYDVENVGTAITENFSYRIKGLKAWTEGTLGTEITGLQVGATYEIVPGIDTSNGIDNPYGEMFEYTVKCVEDDTVETGLYNDEVEGSVTATFYNADNDASAETFTLEDTQMVSVQFRAGNDEAFGNPFVDNPNVIVIGLNASEWTKVEGVYLDSDKTQELSSVDLPGRMREESLKDADFDYYAFEAPAIKDANKRIYLELTSDDSTAVSVDGIAYLFPGNYFIQDDGNLGIGVEDEDDADIAASDPDSVALDFTA